MGSGSVSLWVWWWRRGVTGENGWLWGGIGAGWWESGEAVKVELLTGLTGLLP